MNINFEQLKELLEIVSQNDISELTVESGEERITVKKPGRGGGSAEFVLAPAQATADMPSVAAASVSAPDPEPAPQAVPPPPAPQNNFIKITSPMVGTFYRSASPSKPAFVEVGDAVTVGQTVCIIEAMKLMNDLPSETAGRVVEILAANGATVEYGQPLFLIDPSSA